LVKLHRVYVNQWMSTSFRCRGMPTSPGFSVGCWCLLLVLCCSGASADDGTVALVIINQSGLLKSDEILQRLNYSAADRVDALPFVHIVAAGDSDNRGAWTLLPLFTRFPQLGSNVTWILFMTENTRLNWSHLVRLTRQFDPAKEWFIGHELWDDDATIIHHFAFHEDPSAFKYPLLDAGFLLSAALLKRLCAEAIRDGLASSAFAIDVQHELALHLWNGGRNGVNLTHSSEMCRRHHPDCATWIQPFQPCGEAVEKSSLYFAVKTCSKFHYDRVPVVQQTWAPHTQRLVYYSDVFDKSIPTVRLGIDNTETGHCSKTMAIIQRMGRVVATEKNPPAWFILADDDTILSVQRLQQVLSCYDSQRPVLIGQRYGYASGQSYGYDYITGGGGIVLSRSAVRLLASPGKCRCPQADTPDDMWLGACSENLGISMAHFAGFHQGRPVDYPAALLDTQFLVSFHKHWMVDPREVYAQWFRPSEHVALSPSDSVGYSDPVVLLDAHKSELFEAESRDEL